VGVEDWEWAWRVGLWRGGLGFGVEGWALAWRVGSGRGGLGVRVLDARATARLRAILDADNGKIAHAQDCIASGLRLCRVQDVSHRGLRAISKMHLNSFKSIYQNVSSQLHIYYPMHSENIFLSAKKKCDDPSSCGDALITHDDEGVITR
jgi:hypothetical protein